MRADDVLEGYALVDRYVFHDGVYKGVDSLALKREWIASLPGKPTPAALFLFQASGDAMAPTITDGDLVLTNTHDQDLRDGGVFVIRPKSMPPNHPFMIRRVRQRATGVFELLCEDDPEHHIVEFPIPPDTPIVIIGPGHLVRRVLISAANFSLSQRTSGSEHFKVCVRGENARQKLVSGVAGVANDSDRTVFRRFPFISLYFTTTPDSAGLV
jgi:hypothetical protein